MTKSIIYKKVYIKNDFYAGHWGYVVMETPEDDEYHVTGGSIGDIVPIFCRKELKVVLGTKKT